MRWFAHALLITALHASDINIRIYSEHATSREVLSPAVVRNAHASFRVVVTAPPGALYFLAIQTNPPGIFRISLHRQPPRSSDPLIEERNITFLAGVAPSAGASSTAAETVYLLDLWTPEGTRQPTVRVEALAKTAYWVVAPMEVRILRIDAPSIPSCTGRRVRTESPLETLLGALMGVPPVCSPPLTTIYSVTTRNAAEDAALTHVLSPVSRGPILLEVLALFQQRRWAYFTPDPGESYARVRQLLYREAERSATGQAIREMLQLVPDSR